jgi:hypothetical protein
VLKEALRDFKAKQEEMENKMVALAERNVELELQIQEKE